MIVTMVTEMETELTIRRQQLKALRGYTLLDFASEKATRPGDMTWSPTSGLWLVHHGPFYPINRYVGVCRLDAGARIMQRFEDAAVELSWLGSRDARERNQIRNEYAIAKAELLEALKSE